MSLIYFDKNHEYGTSVIWKLEKENTFLSDDLEYNVPSGILKGSLRELEWIASRYLAYKVDQIIPNLIEKDEYGKPFVRNSPNQISISHSRNYAFYGSSTSHIGIDIQVVNDKIERLTHKFTSKQELRKFPGTLNLSEKLHYIWTIKEAVFKLYGKKELPFKEGILISDCKITNNELSTIGSIIKQNERYEFKALSKVKPSIYFTSAHFTK